MPQPRIAILGDGQMGLVCADALARAGASPVIWGHDAGEVRALAEARSSPRLEGFGLPDEATLEADLRAAVEGAEVVLCAIPTQHIRSVFSQLKGRLDESVPVVSVAKGVEVKRLLLPTEIVADSLGEDPEKPAEGRALAALSGPTIAHELARRLPATMVAASAHFDLAERVQGLFDVPWLRVYASDDPLGVELAGAVKNVIALAAGAVDGLGLGSNAKSALLARGLAEIARLGAALGAKPETFFGVAGVGDLATTCFSPHGRNRSCGEALGRGENLDDYLERTQSVVEGVTTTKAVTAWSIRLGVDMPITHAVHAVLFEGLPVRDAITRLMERPVGTERIV